MSDCCCGHQSAAEENVSVEDERKEACCCDGDAAEARESCCCSGNDAAAEPCCCGGDADDSCCADDPYAGPMTPAVVDFLFLDLAVCDRCQGADDRVFEAVKRCKGVLRACGYDLTLNQILIDSEEKATAYRLMSSPTIRVNGVDICSEVIEDDCGCCSDMADSAVTCRLFPFNGGYYEVPPTDMIVRGIMEVVMQGQKPQDQDAFELPENLRTFFAGVDKKAEEQGANRPSIPEERKRCCCC